MRFSGALALQESLSEFLRPIALKVGNIEMSARQFVQEMRRELIALREQGREAVPVENLLRYLDAATDTNGQDPSAADMERYKAELGRITEEYKANHAFQLAQTIEMFKSVIQVGQGAIRSMILINGGAAVAILAFLGHLARLDPSAVRAYAFCLLPFVAGTLAGGMVAGLTYVCQALYGSDEPQLVGIGTGFHYAAVGVGFASYIAFGIGAWWTFEAFRNIAIEPIVTTAELLIQ